jgi:capsule polysaccharide modification protein KpsS
LKETIIQKLLVFERKIFRRIFGPTKENQIWRVKTNEELDKLIKHKNIINYVKAQRLSWFGHVQRVSDTRTVKKIFNWKPLKTQVQMGGQHQTGHLPNEDQKLDSLRPGSREMERGH